MPNEENHSACATRSIIARFFAGPASVRTLRVVVAILLAALLVFGSYFAVQMILNGPNRVPKTEAARNLMRAEAKLRADADALSQSEYLLALIDAGKIEEAHLFEEDLKQKNISFGPLLYARAQLGFTQNKDDKAAHKLLVRAAESVDEDAGEIARVIWSDYAAVLANSKDYRAALELAQRIEKIKPAQVQDYLRVGSYAEELADYYTASRAYLMVLKLDPFNVLAAERAEELKNSQAERYEAAKSELDAVLAGDGHEFK